MRIAFADESGTDSRSACYAIGVISFDEEFLADFHAQFEELKTRHGVDEELKWTRVRKGHGLINLILDWLYLVMTLEGFAFDTIVVHKDLFRNWQGTQEQQEQAFYQTYTYLLRHIARRTTTPARVFIDDRSDRYQKQHEVVETIGNHMLAQLLSKGRLEAVTKVVSHETPGVQVADVLTGAITTAHLRRLQPDVQINKGKGVAISRLAWMLGWDDLCYDTMPHPRFNVWHFPIEHRARPRSVLPRLRTPVPYVTAEDLGER